MAATARAKGMETATTGLGRPSTSHLPSGGPLVVTLTCRTVLGLSAASDLLVTVYGVGAGRCLWARAGGRVAADAWSPLLAAR